MQQVWRREVKQKMDEYAAKTTRQKYAKEAQYADFRQRIFVSVADSEVLDLRHVCLRFSSTQEVQHDDEAMPPVADLLPQGS